MSSKDYQDIKRERHLQGRLVGASDGQYLWPWPVVQIMGHLLLLTLASVNGLADNLPKSLVWELMFTGFLVYA